MIIKISNGEIKYLYNEKLDLINIGNMNIARASYVEYNKDSKWYIDLSPSNIRYKKDGFINRTDALVYEKEYIEKNIL